jgi:biotin carboxyl carrier protein
MKLRAKIDEREVDVQLEGDGQIYVCRIDQREYKLILIEGTTNGFTFINEGRVLDFQVSRTGSADEFEVRLGDASFEVSVFDPKRLRGRDVSHQHDGGIIEITTAMPGKVVKVSVAEGDEVAQGQGLVVVEAMKMQNEIKAPRAGKVKRISCNEGATVNAGDVLATIE